MGTIASVRDSATFNQVPLGTSVRPFDLDLRSFILPDLNLTLGKRNAFIGAGDRFELLPFDDSWVPFKIIPKFQLVLKTRLKSLHFYISHFVADGLIVSLVNRRTALVQELPAPKFKIWILLRCELHNIFHIKCQFYLTTTRKSEQVNGVSKESRTSLAFTSSKTLSKVIWFGT